MSVQNLEIKELSGDIILMDSFGNEEPLLSHEQLELYSTIIIKENSFAKLSIQGMEEITLGENERFFLDESVVNPESLDGFSELFTQTLDSYTSLLSLEHNLIDDNTYMDFSSLHVSIEESSYDASFDIRDLLDTPTIETKIFSNETHSVELNQHEWQKHDGSVFEDGRTFELYSKNGSGDEVFTLLIEDTISIIHTQG